MGRKKKITEEILEIETLTPDDVLVDAEFYKGNDNLLRKDALMKWTPEMKQEIFHCAKKIIHFAENYFFITTLDDGKQKIKLYKFQKNLLKGFASNRFTICSASRQVGKCLANNTLCKVRNKTTGLIEEITIEDFYNRFSEKTDSREKQFKSV
jgi:hypothetical protein